MKSRKKTDELDPARKLIDWDVVEVSLVDRAANRKRFYVVKADEFAAAMTKIFGPEAEGLLKEIPESSVAPLRAALGPFIPHLEILPSDLLDGLKALVRLALNAAPAASAEAGVDEPAQKSDEPDEHTPEKPIGSPDEYKGLTSFDELLVRTLAYTLPPAAGWKLAADALRAEARRQERAEKSDASRAHDNELVEKHFGIVLDADEAERVVKAAPAPSFRRSLDGQDSRDAESKDLWQSVNLF